MADSTIPTVDLSVFFKEGDGDGKKKAKEVIAEACSKYGFFQIVNHGVPLDLMNRALDFSKAFFQQPSEEKLKSSPTPGAPLPAGYKKQPPNSTDDNEYLLMFLPGSTANVFPANPPEFQNVVEEMFRYMSKTSQVVESILNDWLGLPPNYLKEYNDDRSWDSMVALHYCPADSNVDNTGITEHQDANYITIVLQDDTGGLEVEKNGKWIPVTPIEGTLVVNVGDVIQVLSNKRLKSATHRVVRQNGRSRDSYAFFHNLQGDKWVEPLPQMTTEIGDSPKYRGFLYKEYWAERMSNKTSPPYKPEQVIRITHYAIPTKLPK